MNEDLKCSSWELESDRPLVNPADDEFGYAQFASHLAAAIVSNKNPQGLVLAVHGKWGSGKSSLLNFIKHDLARLPDNRRPVLIDFNPWWFEGREQIAAQLLEQFSSQLPDHLKNVRLLAKLVGKYSKQIADAAADVSGYSWIKKPIASLLGWIPGLKFLTEKTGIPSIKKKVAAALKASGKRFVFVVDDIDRLTPDEARDFFRAIKALADFPEVVYVLFFDREEVAKALTGSLNMDGEAYLEKIIQAPFHLPAVNKEQLQQKLFKGLDAIIESNSMPFPFDKSRWAEVFSDGLERCIRKPRDIIRILNVITVTYPPLAGEVNPVDFISLEFIRVFEAAIYGTIREARDFFCGPPTQLEYKKPEERAYFEKWRESVPEASRDHVVSIVGSLFPKVAHVVGKDNIFYGDQSDWRRELRPCSQDCFGVYFQFGVPSGHVSRAELERLISQRSSEGIAALLVEAKNHIFPDGHSKARDLVERLRDFDQLNAEPASKVIEALVNTAHLLLRKEDERTGFFAIPNRWRITGLIAKLLDRLAPPERQHLLSKLAGKSPGIWCMVDLVSNALQAKKNPSKVPKAMLEFEAGFPEALAKSVGLRLNQASLVDLMLMPELDFIVYRWGQWGDTARIREVFKPMVDDDDRLIELLDKFVRTGLTQSGRTTTESYQLLMQPLSYTMDVQVMEHRIRSIQSRSDLNPRQRAATDRFIQGLQRINNGMNPDGIYYEEDNN